MRIVDDIGLPAPLLKALEAHKHSRGDADFSVTELISPAYQRRLKIKHDDELEVPATGRLFALMGSMWHVVMDEARTSGMDSLEDRFKARLEEVGMPNALLESSVDKWVSVNAAAQELKSVLAQQHSSMDHLVFEQRLFGTFFGKRISGQIDLQDESQRLLSDYKSCSYWTAIYGAKEEWTQQLNIYRALMMQNGKQVDRLQIVAWFRDWSKRQAKYKADYPQAPVHIFELDVWPIERTEAFIKARIDAHENPDPPICSASERWDRGGEWAVEKAGRKSALRLLPTRQEAETWRMSNQKAGENLSIVERPAESVRCLDYCEVKQYCRYGKSLL